VKLISSAPKKTYQADPAPTWLMKDMRELRSPLISLLFSKSLTTGCFPKHLINCIIAGEMWRHLCASKDYGNYRRNNTVILLGGHLSRVVHLPWYQIGRSHGQRHPLKHAKPHIGLGLSQVGTHLGPHSVHFRPPTHSVDTISFHTMTFSLHVFIVSLDREF